MEFSNWRLSDNEVAIIAASLREFISKRGMTMDTLDDITQYAQTASPLEVLAIVDRFELAALRKEHVTLKYKPEI